MSHLSVFRIFWKAFQVVVFFNINEVLSGELEKESIICVGMG